MVMPLWMRVKVKKEDIVVVDCGYVTEQGARDRADSIFALGVGKKNLDWLPSTGDLRIGILIPLSKVKKVFESLKITKKTSWWGATHSYLTK